MSRKLPSTPASTSQPATPTHPDLITLLAVSPNREDRRSLQSILDAPGWSIRWAKDLREAEQLLRQSPSLVICDSELPDGSWQEVLRAAETLDMAPPVIVATKNADQRFWAEVLNLGGFDVLLKPFEISEVSQVLGMAARQQHSLAFA